MVSSLVIFFFFNDTATTEIYTLSLHDALPISLEHSPPVRSPFAGLLRHMPVRAPQPGEIQSTTDRKSTRLNSSHVEISYAVFCLKKKKKKNTPTNRNKHQHSTRQPVTSNNRTL